jgi:PAS domain S-box-containing protein
MDLADKNLFDSKSALPNDNDRWQYIIDLLASHFSIALIEIDGTKIINLNSQAQKILKISYLEGNLKLSDLFVDSPPLFSLRKKSRIILHTRSENKPVLLLLIKILPGRKKLFEIRDNSLPLAISRPTNETVKENSAFIALLLKSGPMVYYSYTPEKRDLVWYSDQIEFLTGYRLDDFKDNSGLWLSRIYADDLPLVKGKFDNYVPNQHVSCEYRWMDHNNRIIWILDQAIMVEAPDRKWLVVGNFMDITDRKEAEFAVIENERNYREIFNSSNEAIFIHDHKTGKILDVNDTMLRMFRITYEKALSKGINHISLNEPPYDEEHARKYIEKTFTSGETQQFNWISRRDDQTPFWSEVTLKAITIGSEKKIMASVKNIDQKKKAEDQIKYQNDFEKLILDISTRFINIPYDEVDSSIEQSIKQICNFAKTDAGYLFLFDEVEQTSNLKYLWQRKTMNFNRDQLSRIRVEISDWYTKKIKSGEIVMFEDLNDFPQGEEALKSIISSQGVRSFVDIPLVYQNLVIGTLGIAVAKPARKWLSYEISLLRLTGQIFVNAMKRKESFLKLLDSEEKYRHIIENQTDLIIKLSPEGHLIFVSLHTARFLD